METEIKNTNPIHPDKITETPHLLPYAHHFQLTTFIKILFLKRFTKQIAALNLYLEMFFISTAKKMNPGPYL